MINTFTKVSAILAVTSVDGDSLPHAPTNPGEIRTALGIMFGIIGALALLFIVISGVRYMLSGGDPGKTAKAKDGIIYALVGLVLAIFAETIVIFVVGQV
jgi:hypothetical protein